MDTSTGTPNSGEQRLLTIHEFCIWAEITQPEAAEEICSGRLRLQPCEADMVINLDEAFRWLKDKHGVTVPFYWRPLPKDERKVNPFTDDLMIAPLPLSTVVL